MRKGNRLAGALARAPREKAGERLSPGVYRGDRGGLVTQSGRQIQSQPRPPMPQNQPAPMPQNQWPAVAQISSGQQIFNNNPQQSSRQFPMPPSVPYPRLENAVPYPRLENAPLMGDNNNFDFGSIGKTPFNWSNNQIPNMIPFAPSANMPQMPQPSANMGGQYRLSPGVYGSREQAMNQYEQQMQPMYQPATGMSAPAYLRR